MPSRSVESASTFMPQYSPDVWKREGLSREWRFWLAVARFQSGDAELARDALERAIELDSGLRLKAVDEPLLGGFR